MAFIKKYAIITCATLFMAVGIYYFKFPHNFTFGGVSGYANIFAKLTPMSASGFTLVCNIALLVIGFFFLGRQFAVTTTYTTVLLSFALYLLERFQPMSHTLTDQPMLELIFAVMMPAMASAVLFNLGASSGGTDVIAMILRKYTSVNIGAALAIADGIGVAVAFFVFDIKTGLYSLLGFAARSLAVDLVIESILLSKYFTVITEHPENICDFVVKTLGRSATVAEAEGAFTHTRKYLVLAVMNRNQAARLTAFVKQNDPHAFMMISNTSQIVGKGFHTI
jgi:uncharacterized membrane-anchored protein YitT (DUF2179 family)